MSGGDLPTRALSETSFDCIGIPWLWIIAWKLHICMKAIIFSGMTFATSDLNYDNYPWKQRMNVNFQKLPARKRQISFLPIKLAQHKNPFCFSEANKLKKQGMSSCKETSSKSKESHLFLSQISSRNNKFIVLSQLTSKLNEFLLFRKTSSKTSDYFFRIK